MLCRHLSNSPTHHKRTAYERLNARSPTSIKLCVMPMSKTTVKKKSTKKPTQAIVEGSHSDGDVLMLRAARVEREMSAAVRSAWYVLRGDMPRKHLAPKSAAELEQLWRTSGVGAHSNPASVFFDVLEGKPGGRAIARRLWHQEGDFVMS